MSHALSYIVSAQYLTQTTTIPGTSMSATSSYVSGTLAVTYSNIRTRGVTDSIYLNGLTSSTLLTMPTTWFLGTTTASVGIGYTALSLGTSSTGPLSSGTYNL